MPSNDEVVHAIPSIQCPSCGRALSIENKRRIDKYSREQRQRLFDSEANRNYVAETASNRRPHPGDTPSEMMEKNYVIVSCDNFHCEQYNKFKLVQLPRMHAPSIKADL